MAICNKTGMTAIYNQSHNLFLSPIADGPIKFTGTLDSGMNIENVTKYGRSFSVIKIPYAFKLLMQELSTMNVQMRIITEDNIDQLTSMSFSDNIIKLTGEQTVGSAFLNRRMNNNKAVKKYATTYSASGPKSFGWIMTKKDEFISMIVDDNGEPTDTWKAGINDEQALSEFPVGWNKDDLIRSDGSVIDTGQVISGLIPDRSGGNWDRVIARLNPSLYIGSTPYQKPLPTIQDESASPPYTVDQEPQPYTGQEASPPYTVDQEPQPYTVDQEPQPYTGQEVSPPYTVGQEVSPPLEIIDINDKPPDDEPAKEMQELIIETQKGLEIESLPTVEPNSLLFRKPSEAEEKESLAPEKKTVKFS